MQQWNDFLRELERDFGKATTDTWLRSLSILSFDAGNIYLQAADHFQALWFEEHIRPQLKKRPLTYNGKKVKVHLTVRNEEKKGRTTSEEKEETQISFPSDPIESHCHFSQFVPGKHNVLPFRMICELAGYDYTTNTFDQTPHLKLGEINPIYLYGHPGYGKTHLVMSLATALKNRGVKVRYVKAETFTDHVISAYRSSHIQEFREAYRTTDVLIVDDINIFSKKSTTQEELFHTFNYLHTRGKQILVTSNCAPRALTEVEERLISRFEWGITLSLEKLSREEKRMLLEKRLASLDFPLHEEASTFLLETFSSHGSLVRAAEALVLRTHVDAKGHKRSTDFMKADIERLLSDLISAEHKTMLTPEKLLAIVAKTYQVTPEDILGKSKTKEYVIPRQVAMYLCRKELGLPYLRIGSIFSRDHSTVMSSVRLISKAIENQDRRIIDPLGSVQKLVLSA